MGEVSVHRLRRCEEEAHEEKAIALITRQSGLQVQVERQNGLLSFVLLFVLPGGLPLKHCS
jgi:hypothetical protein